MTGLAIEILGVGRCEAMHHVADLVLLIIKQKVNMVVHEAPREHRHLMRSRFVLQQRYVMPAVFIVLKEQLTAISPARHVIEARVCNLSCYARHSPSPLGIGPTFEHRLQSVASRFRTIRRIFVVKFRECHCSPQRASSKRRAFKRVRHVVHGERY